MPNAHERRKVPARMRTETNKHDRRQNLFVTPMSALFHCRESCVEVLQALDSYRNLVTTVILARRTQWSGVLGVEL